MRVLIAGGGTGGHLFPGIALAEELTTRHHKNDVVFVGTDRGLEARVVPAAGYTLEIISARGLKGMGISRLLRGLMSLPVTFFQSMSILRRYRPDVVVGVGGYASGPAVFCAWLLRIPTAVQEQNTRPGITNRILGKVVDAVFIAFEGARQFFPAQKVQLVGNPIRRKLMDNYLRSSVAHDRFNVLVFGGSLGAKSINQRMLEALDHLEDLKNEIHFLHQTGKNDREQVERGYREKGFHADVVEFIDDMSGAYARSELIISRSGAMTLAELTVCKKASILIPFPYATDNHQELNAQEMVAGGAALMFRESELTGKKLADALRELKMHPEKLKRMEKQAGLLGRPEAAKELADVCVQLMVERWGPQGRERKDKKLEVTKGHG
jgi:UDP-N-acetylglucosamine--N-acetylmuramyl-(pentapeptide) pyrophosphoryl-undecaprenol N-acetylglucosamine transferase